MNASGYGFQASGCFFQHPDTLLISVSFLRLATSFSKFLPNDSLYIMGNRCIVLLVLIPSTMARFKSFCFKFFEFVIAVCVLQVVGIRIPSSYIRIALRYIRMRSQHPDTLRAAAFYSIRMPSWASQFTFRHPNVSSKHPDTLRLISPDIAPSVSECTSLAFGYPLPEF